MHESRTQSYGLAQMIIGRIVTGLGNGINVSGTGQPCCVDVLPNADITPFIAS